MGVGCREAQHASAMTTVLPQSQLTYWPSRRSIRFGKMDSCRTDRLVRICWKRGVYADARSRQTPTSLCSWGCLVTHEQRRTCVAVHVSSFCSASFAEGFWLHLWTEPTVCKQAVAHVFDCAPRSCRRFVTPPCMLMPHTLTSPLYQNQALYSNCGQALKSSSKLCLGLWDTFQLKFERASLQGFKHAVQTCLSQRPLVARGGI